MSQASSGAHQMLLQTELVPSFRRALVDGPGPKDPAEFELLAATLLIPLELHDLPPHVPLAVLAEIEQGADTPAAGLLAALGVLASGDIAAAARASAERLAQVGVTSPAAERVGRLTVREAVRMSGDGAELFVAILGRPRTRRLQLAILGIELDETGGALVDCVLTPPVAAAEVRSMLETAVGDARPEPIEVEQLAARVAAAAQRAKDLGVALGSDGAIALPIIARALTGDPAGLPRPETMLPWEEDDDELIVDPAGDHDGFRFTVELLLDELEAWARANCPADGPVWRTGDFVGSTMLEWKGGYADGRLARWTVDDLAEFLLDYFPRKVSMPEETVADAIDCVVGFLRFLDDRGSLSGERLEALQDACEDLRAEFVARNADPKAWGLAKSMVTHMLKDGVDPEDPSACERWMAEFNERPRAERDAVLGAAADRMIAGFGPPSAPSGRPPKKQAGRRKAQRAARKRNRRG